MRHSGLSINLAGSIETGSRTHRVFLSTRKFEQGPNYTITLLHLSIFPFVRAALNGGPSLPKRLVLQLDSCWKENKNKYMYAYALYLVALGWFEMVDMQFMVKGHTHDFVDAMFGLIWSAIYRLGTRQWYLSRITIPRCLCLLSARVQRRVPD